MRRAARGRAASRRANAGPPAGSSTERRIPERAERAMPHARLRTARLRTARHRTAGLPLGRLPTGRTWRRGNRRPNGGPQPAVPAANDGACRGSGPPLPAAGPSAPGELPAAIHSPVTAPRKTGTPGRYAIAGAGPLCRRPAAAARRAVSGGPLLGGHGQGGPGQGGPVRAGTAKAAWQGGSGQGGSAPVDLARGAWHSGPAYGGPGHAGRIPVPAPVGRRAEDQDIQVRVCGT